MSTGLQMKRQITREDILPMAAYESERRELRRDLVTRKKFRRQDVGPVCTFYFENYDTMWAQVHEMLYIEKRSEEHTSELQSLMRISYAVFCLKKKKRIKKI